MPWLYLAAAILFEVTGTTLLKLSGGFVNVVYGFAALGVYGVSFVFLSLTMRHLPVSVSYAVWSGLGTLAIVLIGIFAFKEPAGFLRILCMAMIVVGAVGLHVLVEPQPK